MKNEKTTTWKCGQCGGVGQHYNWCPTQKGNKKR